jgi:hypothetical protein
VAAAVCNDQASVFIGNGQAQVINGQETDACNGQVMMAERVGNGLADDEQLMSMKAK